MIFVDTGAWYASLVPTDPDHARAAQWLGANHSPLVTTDYVIDETLTLLRVRGEKRRALLLSAEFFHHELAELHKITATDLDLAWKIFEQFDDKSWSFTDCTSKSSWNNSISRYIRLRSPLQPIWNNPSRAVRPSCCR